MTHTTKECKESLSSAVVTTIAAAGGAIVTGKIIGQAARQIVDLVKDRNR